MHIVLNLFHILGEGEGLFSKKQWSFLPLES